MHPTRRTVTHHRRTEAGIDTRIVVNEPITMAPPEIVITVEEIYGGEPRQSSRRMPQLLRCRMLSLTEVNRIVDLAASAVLTPDRLSRVFSEYTTDSDGRDALLLTIVVRTDKAKEVNGDSAVDTIVRIHNDLERAGEERTAMTRFATEAELEDELDADADSES